MFIVRDNKRILLQSVHCFATELQAISLCFTCDKASTTVYKQANIICIKMVAQVNSDLYYMRKVKRREEIDQITRIARLI